MMEGDDSLGNYRNLLITMKFSDSTRLCSQPL